MDIVIQVIKRYKEIRSLNRLRPTHHCNYGFIGIGNHSMENLFPVLAHFQSFPSWICCTSEKKAALITQKYDGTQGTTDITRILTDESVKGILVSASPMCHFTLASQILRADKALFIEKPPCYGLKDLKKLIDIEHQHPSSIVMVGMQKRYAPATNILLESLKRKALISYNLRYLVGAYPEGNPVYDLFIHPIDYVCFLFGKAEMIGCKKVGSDDSVSYFVMLRHGNTTGILELSTAYSWKNVTEQLVINTKDGVYELNQMEELKYIPKRKTVLGVPMEKVFGKAMSVQYLLSRNNANPTMFNNQIFTQGYYGEIKEFLDKVEANTLAPKGTSSFESMYETYTILDDLEKCE